MKKVISLVAVLAGFSVAANAYSLTVQNDCALTKTGLVVVNVPIKLNVPGYPDLDTKYIHIKCDKGQCDGFMTAGNWLQSDVMHGLKMVSINSKRAVMTWGMSEFTLDRESKLFTWKTSDGGAGATRCSRVGEN